MLSASVPPILFNTGKEPLTKESLYWMKSNRQGERLFKATAIEERDQNAA